MRVLQRIVIVIACVMCLVGVPAVPLLQRQERVLKQWEKIQTERFLKEICMGGSIETADYQQLLAGLEMAGNLRGIEIEEFCKEQDISGSEYYHLILWEELKNKLWKDGCCAFEEGSILNVTIKRQNHTETSVGIYWRIINGRKTE